MSKRQLNRRQQWRIAKIQTERSERANKRESRAVDSLQGGDLGAEQLGLIIAHFGVQVEVEVLEGSEAGSSVRCHLRANLPALVTGDRIVFRTDAQQNGIIVAQLPRHSELCRPDFHQQLKPIAANIDLLVIVFAAEPTPHAHLIDRYLIAAEYAHIQPLLLLNKTDLINPNNSVVLDPMLTLYRKLGYPLLEISTKNNDGLVALTNYLNHRVSVFIGQSGVGKSSLVNHLLCEQNERVGELSNATGLGNHTTTTARLFHLKDGGQLIDSPGIREFGLSHVTRAVIETGFIELQPLLGLCRFRNCQHDQEPDCALLKAVDDGRIQPQRMHSYKALLKDLELTTH